MSGIALDFKEPELEEFRAERSGDYYYPKRLKLVLKACYHKVELRETPSGEPYPLNEPVSLYLANPKGYIVLSNLNTGEKAEIKAGIYGFWHPFGYPAKVDIVSEPLSLQEIQEIDELLSGESRLYWNVECLGFLEQSEISTLRGKLNYKLSEWDLRGPVHVFFHGPTRVVTISREDFVKNVLEPAEMLRREFIEVIVEPINEKELNKLPDDDVREALRILFEKQKVLLEALKKLRHATTTADYRGVIGDVRQVIEGLTPHTQEGQQVYQALKRAFTFKIIPIARKTDSKALDELSEEIAKTIMGQNKSFSVALFKYSSKLGVHGKTKLGELYKLYKPCPSKSEAEFAVLQAMLLLNYMIRTIKKGEKLN